MHNSIFMGSQEQAASFFALSGVYAIGLGSLSGPLTKRCLLLSILLLSLLNGAFFQAN